MLNRDGVRKKTYGAPKQILANVGLQSSVGCIVPASIGVDVGGGVKLAKAGTPINIDFMNLQNVASAAAADKPMNAVLLHDVDVSSGNNANGTALLFGFVNLNRVDSDVVTKITAAQKDSGATSQLTFLKM